jgi:hypothetical protein
VLPCTQQRVSELQFPSAVQHQDKRLSTLA